MKIIEFPQQTTVIARNQPEYIPMPAYQDLKDPQGMVICCWKLSLLERLRLLLTGKIWHAILTFKAPLQPQMLSIENPFNKNGNN